MAKFVWLGQKLGLAAKPKGDDDLDKTGDDQQLSVSSQPPVTAATTFPPARSVQGSFTPAVGNPLMPVYAVSGRMYPRYVGGASGETKATGHKPGEDSPLTKRAAAVLAATSTY